MNSKILIAFVSGAVIASGIVYMAIRQDLQPRPRTEVAAPPVAPPNAVVPPAPLPPIEAAPPPQRELSSRKPIREKPSPLHPAGVRTSPVARSQDPGLTPVAVVKPPEAQPVSPPPDLSEPQQAAPDPAPVVAAPVPAPPESAPAAPPAPVVNAAPTVTIAVGTVIPVRIGETISVSHYRTGDTFLATLDRPLVVDGWVIAERGSRLEGRVVQATPPSHTSDSSHLEIELVKLSTADGQRIAIHTQSYKKDAGDSSGHEVAKIAGGTALGAAIGAAAGGGKGAAIGAGIGGAAGVASVALSHGKPAEITVETRISFKTVDPVTITERQN